MFFFLFFTLHSPLFPSPLISFLLLFLTCDKFIAPFSLIFSIWLNKFLTFFFPSFLSSYLFFIFFFRNSRVLDKNGKDKLNSHDNICHTVMWNNKSFTKPFISRDLYSIHAVQWNIFLWILLQYEEQYSNIQIVVQHFTSKDSKRLACLIRCQQ